MPDGSRAILLMQAAAAEAKVKAPCKDGVRERVTGFKRQRLLDQRNCRGRTLRHHVVDER
jgi:hypothetical protein